MGLRTSVGGCIALVGVMSVATGCSGRVPGQAMAVDLRAMAPLAKQFAAPGGKPAVAAAARFAAAPDAKLMTAGPAKAGEVAGVVLPAKADAAKPGDEVAVAPGVASEPAPAVKAPETPGADQAAAGPLEAVATLMKADVAPVAPADPAAPAIAFMIPGLADLASAFEPAAETKVLFQDSFEAGLDAWVSRGLGLPTGAASADDHAVVLATSRARRSLWIKTRTEIDLGASAQPRLRLDFKGQPVALKAVWETEHGDFPEEILLAPMTEGKRGTSIENEEAEEGAPLEFDLTALRQRPGRLVLVARAPRGGAAAPVLDGVTIFDAAGAAPATVEIAAR